MGDLQAALKAIRNMKMVPPDTPIKMMHFWSWLEEVLTAYHGKGIADSATTVAENHTPKSTDAGHTTHKTGGSEGQELKPCPFCGVDANCIAMCRNEWRYYVRCARCGAMSRECLLREEAIAAWNRREGEWTYDPRQHPWIDGLNDTLGRYNALPAAEFQRLVLRGMVGIYKMVARIDSPDKEGWEQICQALDNLEADDAHNG